MNRKDIIKLLDATRFVPFRIHLTDGKTYDIRHREFVWVFPTRLEIAKPASDVASRAMEDSDFVSLLHIVRIEPLQEAA
jgi:hypothetical protein